jgi:hypothetical protein
MTLPRETEQEVRARSEKIAGSIIVILGALASIVLWLIVLANGDPIRPFTTDSASVGYALGITFPVICISILATIRLREKKR